MGHVEKKILSGSLYLVLNVVDSEYNSAYETESIDEGPRSVGEFDVKLKGKGDANNSAFVCDVMRCNTSVRIGGNEVSEGFQRGNEISKRKREGDEVCKVE